MSMIIRNKAVTLDGTAGGTINVLPEYKVIQIAIAGRTTGTITVTGTSLGGNGAEAFSPAFTIDLTSEYTGKVSGFAMESLTFTPSVAGADFDVTITQWPV